LLEAIDQVHRRVKPHPSALVINPARTQRCRKVRFPGAWSADQYRVLCSLSKPKIGQFLDLTPLDA
jgi:hypothetical protein